jgi:hypothetical protein
MPDDIQTDAAKPPAAHRPLPFLNSPRFSEWRDPASGARSFILTDRAAPIQQTFYFTTRSVTQDFRFFWFYCAFPPGGDARAGRTLGVLDFATDEIRCFPETQFSEASPLVDPGTGEVFWCSGSEIWARSPRHGEPPRLINKLPDDLTKHRRVSRVATHLTFSSDRRSVNIDAEIGAEWHIGHAPLDGSDVEVWQSFDRCYNHGQYSPADPELQLIAQDYHAHPVTGKVTAYENRLWTIRKGGAAVPVYDRPPSANYRGTALNAHMSHDGPRTVTDPRAMHGHEWWAPDGKGIWYVHYGHGVEFRDLAGRTTSLVWPLKTVSHAHSTEDARLLVGDNQPNADPSDSRVVFFNRATRSNVNLVTHMPHASAFLKRYHVDPHPQFCFHDRAIAYTTTVLGRIDVAFAVVDELVEQTLTNPSCK